MFIAALKGERRPLQQPVYKFIIGQGGMEGWKKTKLYLNCRISVKDGHEIGMPSGVLERGLSNVY